MIVYNRKDKKFVLKINGQRKTIVRNSSTHRFVHLLNRKNLWEDKSSLKSQVVSIEDIEKLAKIHLGNNGSSFAKNLSNFFEIKKVRENDNPYSKIIGYQIIGHSKSKFSQSIPVEVKKELQNEGCVFTGSQYNVEIDHKDGLKKETKTELQDYQPINPSVNKIKRNACTKCKASGLRPKAFNIPQFAHLKEYGIDYTTGGESLSESGCSGCYWKDPAEFNKASIEIILKNNI